MKLLVIGSCNTFYVKSYIDLFLSDNEINIAYVNNNLNYFYRSTEQLSVFNYKNAETVAKLPSQNIRLNLVGYIKYIAKKLGLEDSKLQRFVMSCVRKVIKRKSTVDLERFISEFSPDAVFLFWGTTMKEEAALISKMNLPMILSVNTYPVSFEKKYIPSKYDVKYFNSFNGLIFSSKRMKDYFDSNYLSNCFQNNIVNPDFIQTSKVERDVTKFLSITPKRIKKVIFLGNVNFSYRTGDDVRDEIYKLANSGVQVYIQSSKGACNEYKNINYYSPYTYDEIKNGKLIDFINSDFDAVLYCYNTQESLREKLSVTTRFSLCEGCLVPVLMKKNKYLAIEEEFASSTTFALYDKAEDVGRGLYDIKKASEMNSQSKRAVILTQFIKSFV